MLWLIGWALLGWMVLFAAIDTPARPAWRVRNLYRLFALLLTILAVFTTHKAILYRQELRSLIQTCR